MSDEPNISKLTACKECRHCDCPDDIPHAHASCRSPRAKPYFHAWSGKRFAGVEAMCLQVNTDGHCPHFEAKAGKS